MNGGTPPLTFSMFNHVVQAIGDPDRPLDDVDLSNVKLVPEEGFLSKETITDMKLCQGQLAVVC